MAKYQILKAITLGKNEDGVKNIIKPNLKERIQNHETGSVVRQDGTIEWELVDPPVHVTLPPKDLIAKDKDEARDPKNNLVTAKKWDECIKEWVQLGFIKKVSIA